MKHEPKVKVTNLDPMIIIKSWTEGIKFECHKEESLISSKFFEEQIEEPNLMFVLIFIQKLIPWLQ